MGQPFVSIRYHFVWSTQGRRPWLTLALMPDVLACLRSKCSELGVISLAVGGVEDHVHVLVGAPASLSPSVIVGQLKGASSHRVNHVLRTTEPFAWQKGYGVFSLSRSHLDVVRAYVLRQPEHHAQASLWNDFERCDDEP